MINRALLIFNLLLLSLVNFAQDLDAMLAQEEQNKTEFITATFKGTRIVNGHSVETRKKGSLEFLISHRFGRLNTGFYELFGLDNSNIRFGFEYALTDNLSIAIGRSSFEKTYDGYIKYKLLKQKRGAKPFPFTLTLFSSITEKTLKDYQPEDKPTFTNRLTYTSQAIIARKISSGLSLQLIPTYIHFNTVKSSDDNDVFAVGLGSRVKVSNRISINAEYFYTLNPFTSINTHNSIALGVDIETGGHVFQLILTNSIAMIEKGFIAETTGNFFKGDIHFGFNISRTF
jgi:hypothetical protein